VPVAEIRRLVPDGLTVQEYGGTSWVGVVPFRMTGVMRRPLPEDRAHRPGAIPPGEAVNEDGPVRRLVHDLEEPLAIRPSQASP